MQTELSRRGLLKTGAAVAVAAGSQFFTGIPALADYAVGPTLRRNAFNMAANDPILRGYRRAIQLMRALPDTNPCSWFYQAAIHGTLDNRNLLAWNTCHTQPNFFWAWHRMYLYWFERIVRKHAGMYDWAIPYWDWTNPAQRALPAPFRASGNLLFDATRSNAINTGTPLSTGLATSVANAMALTNYFNAQGGIDGPHGSVHGTIGGNMGSVKRAAQDPIFWVHHAQIDRLWNLWLAQGNRSSPVNDAAWRNSTYTFFDECCQPVRMSGCDVLRAALQLSYAYEGEPGQVNQYCPRVIGPVFDVSVLSAQLTPGIMLTERPIRVPVLPRDPGTIGPRIREIARTRGRGVALRIGNVEADAQPGISWEVHVGPRGFTPGPRTLVGMIGLFSSGLKDRTDHFHAGQFVFSINAAARAADPATLEVTFVPVSGLGREAGAAALQVRPRAPVRIGEIAVFVDEPLPMPAREEQEQLRREEAAR